MYLFEAVGMLISQDNCISLSSSGVGASSALDKHGKTKEYLQALISPMVSQIQDIMNRQLYKLDPAPSSGGDDANDESAIVAAQPVRTHLNRLIMAIGSISKGFPAYQENEKDPQAAPPGWTLIFRDALNAVMVVLQELSSSVLIRDAVFVILWPNQATKKARFTFQRMMGCVGPLILPLLSPLLTTGLLAASCTRELVDMLPFIGLTMHRYDKELIGPLFDTLLSPLLERIFYLLNQPTQGTDEAVLSEDLRRAYLSFLGVVIANGFEGLFLTDGTCRYVLC